MWKTKKIIVIIAVVTILLGLQFPIFTRSFADGNVTIVQDNSSGGQSINTATCGFGSNVHAGNTLVVSLDAVFINNPVTSIVDTLGNTFTSIDFTMNSATTWVQVWESSGISSGGADSITITYTSGTTGSFQITCDEFQSSLTFTNVGGQGTNQNNCNTCNLNLTATTHKINLLVGYSGSTTASPTGFSYVFLNGMVAKSGSSTCQAISGSSNCILMFHAEANTPVSVVADSAVSITCSPACSQNPNFEIAFFAAQNTITITFTQSGLLSPFGSGVLVINNTVYSIAQLPISFNYNSNNLTDHLNYGYFSNVNGQPFSSASGCSTNKDGVLQPSVTNTCTLTAIYSGLPAPSGCSVCSIVIQQITSVIVFLLPSLFVLFLFLIIGTRVFNVHGDSLVLLMIIGLSVITALTGLMLGTFVPMYMGIITIVFMIIGFIYFKRVGK